MAAAAKQRVREFLDEQTQKLVTLRDQGVSMTTPGAKAGETILRLLDTKCCTEWRPESFAYPIGVLVACACKCSKMSFYGTFFMLRIFTCNALMR